ncbi:hypothetical protein AA103196_0988 [Ameyamaea chiangmaiensis NBRC 103196]|nr:hypothetical protein AA103196_0988 [Ameyamaea chiangmaiensis NBRC 103196]
MQGGGASAGESPPKPTIDGGDEPPHDSIMQARVAVLEQIAKDTKAPLDRIEKRMDRIDTRFDKFDERHDRDFRLTFGALITTALGLAALMAKGFHWF